MGKEEVRAIDSKGDSTTKTPEKLPEKFERNSNQLIEFIRCKVLFLCNAAEINSETQEEARVLKQEISEAEKTLALTKLRDKKKHIGNKSITRYLLFGTNNDVVDTHGSFSSEKDRNLWVHIQEKKKENHPLLETLKKTRGATLEISEEMDINFARNLDELWKKKIDDYGKVQPDIEAYYRERMLPLIKDSKNWKKISLKEYSDGIKKDIKTVVTESGGYSGIQNTLEKKMGFDKKRATLAMNILKSIGSDDLIALAMTEIMDRVDPEFNLRLFDFLLKNAGVEYIAHIPALHDSFLSMGGYQHTKFSVGGKLPAGSEAGAHKADRIFAKGELLKDASGKKISIETMTAENQHKATYLLAMINISGVVRSLGEESIQMPEVKSKKGIKQKSKFEEVDLTDVLGHCMKKDKKLCISIFLQYTAASHNNPLAAKIGLEDWLINYHRLGAKAGDKLGEYIEKATAKQNAEKQRKNMAGMEKSEVLVASR